MNKISQAAAAMGRAKSPAKTAAARANGAKGGSPRHWYLILSGEGETGTWEARQTTAYGLRRIVASLRKIGMGSRWATGWEMVETGEYETVAVQCVEGQGREPGLAFCSIEVGGMRSLTRALILALGVPPEAIPGYSKSA